MQFSAQQITPLLEDSKIQRIAAAAEKLIKSMPNYIIGLNPLRSIKKPPENIKILMAMSNEEAGKMNKIRECSAIYGRIGSKKRKLENSWTLYCVSIFARPCG